MASRRKLLAAPVVSAIRRGRMLIPVSSFSGPGLKFRKMTSVSSITTAAVSRSAGGMDAAALESCQVSNSSGRFHSVLALAAAAAAAAAAGATTAYVTAGDLATSEDEPMALLVSSLTEIVGADNISTDHEM